MPPGTQTKALVAGVLAGCIFLAAISGLVGGFLFFYLPLVPLFVVGLGTGPRAAIWAALVASLVVGIVAGLPGLLLFMLAQALPAMFLCRRLVLWRETKQGRQWYPVGYAFTLLSVAGAAMFILIALFYAGEGQSLSGLLSEGMEQDMAGAEGRLADAMRLLLSEWTFVVFAATIWSWLLLVYGAAWVAQFLLKGKGHIIRPSLAVEPFDTPHWLLVLLVASGALSIAGSADMEFIGKTVLLVLLYPYFLSGLAQIHRESQGWAMRPAALLVMYLGIILLLWPAAIIACFGVTIQVRMLMKGTSNAAM